MPVVCFTEQGTPYLTESHICALARPEVHAGALAEFLGGFQKSLAFGEYLDFESDPPPVAASGLALQNGNFAAEPGAMLAMQAGQLCYMSFGPARSKRARHANYIENILASGHGSVLEHANYTFLFYGVSRSLTHELVRHRAGFAYSQVSQRYVDGAKLRFVCRPEWQDAELVQLFKERIDKAREAYEKLGMLLLARDKNQERQRGQRAESFERKTATERRKSVNQAARACLPNETEAPIVVTANARAWRHFLAMRGSLHAEPEIRALAVKLCRTLVEMEPALFADCAVVTEPGDGPVWPRQHVSVKYPKV